MSLKNKLKLKINISTRLLAYFLVVSIIPIFILALSSAFIIDSSLNQRMTADLNIKSEFFWQKYNEDLSNLGKYKLKDVFYNEKVRKNFDFVIIYDLNKNILFRYIPDEEKIIKNIKNVQKPSADNFNEFETKLNNNNFSSAILNSNDINTLKLTDNNILRANKALFVNYCVKKIIINNKDCYAVIGKLPDSNLIDEGFAEKDIVWFIEKSGDILFSNIMVNNFSKESSHFFKIYSVKVNNQSYSSIAFPLKDNRENIIAKLVIAIPKLNFDEVKEKNRLIILKIALLVSLGGIALAYALARTITTPIKRISEAVTEIESGNFKTKVEIKSNDELGLLANSFNNMAENLDERTEKILAFNELLINQNNKIEAILNSSADGILTINSQGEIIGINSKISEWTGFNESQLKNQIFYEIINFQDDRNYPIEYLNQIKDFKEFSKYFPNSYINNDLTGEKLSIDISYSEILNEREQNNKSYVLILRDITKRKELDRLKEDFVATLTHDLKVPLLANVQTFDHLIKGFYGNLSQQQNFIIEQMISSNKDLLKMVNIILDSYKYEAGKYNLVKKNFNLAKLIKESISEISSLLTEKELQLNLNNYNDIQIYADKHEIKRVILNLLSNAIKYTNNDGKIEINLFVEKEKNIIKFSIKDNGIGISENSLNNLFDRYSKGGKTLRKVGTGLGLYLSKQIIEAHGGKIWVESTKDTGSTFHFSLPFYVKD